MSTERKDKGPLVPPPLVQSRGPMGEAARHFAQQTSAVFGEAVVYDRVTAAVKDGPRRRGRALIAAAIVATSASAALLVDGTRAPSTAVVTPPASRIAPEARSASVGVETSPRRIALAGRAPGLDETPASPPGPVSPVGPRRYSSVVAGTRFRSARREARQADPAPAAAELALYELAVAERDRLADPGRALETFRSHRARFPTGVLRVEVMQSIVELLPRLGRYREALEESARLLAEAPPGERAGDLHLLRGNLFREALGDCAGAMPEYAAAAVGAGRAADDGAFFLAACLEILGRNDESRQAYRAYLLRPHRAHAAEAEARLRALP